MAETKGIWAQEFTVRQYHLDFQGRISAPNICRMLQEAAAHHAESLNLGSSRLRESNLTWVLSRFHLKLEDGPRWPKWNEKIRVQTWRSGVERIFALRDYKVLNDAGEVLAVATSYWAIIDLVQRRPAAIPQEVMDQLPVEQPRALESRLRKIGVLDRADHKKTFRVCQGDLDENKHTNNVSYVSWALEAIPQETWSRKRLSELELIYRVETFFGDEIASLAQEESEAGQAVFLHKIVGQADKEVAAARTRWI